MKQNNRSTCVLTARIYEHTLEALLQEVREGLLMLGTAVSFGGEGRATVGTALCFRCLWTWTNGGDVCCWLPLGAASWNECFYYRSRLVDPSWRCRRITVIEKRPKLKIYRTRSH